jgi:hypothetical protein
MYGRRYFAACTIFNMASGNQPTDDASQVEAALLAAIARQKPSDPLIGAKIAGREILNRLIKAMTDDRGVHAESLFTALGALGGFSCQMAIRQECENANAKELPFIVVTTNDGKNLVYGDRLNAPLLESQYSIWSLCVAIAQKLGGTLPDLREIVQHVTKVAGTSEFGRPRIPTGNQPGDSPINYVRHLWPPVLSVLKKFCGGPQEWHIAIGIAAQEAISQAKSAINPGIAVAIIMESAIPLSKIDPREAIKG